MDKIQHNQQQKRESKRMKNSDGNGRPKSKWLSKAFYIYISILVLLVAYCYNNQMTTGQKSELYEISHRSLGTLSQLVKTKFFRIIRINLEQECSLMVMNRLCKSSSCTVCRCDEKDIPLEWQKTDKVVSYKKRGTDVWGKERESKKEKQNRQFEEKWLEFERSWVWHVQDEENDKGQYFDIDTNVESFTSYNGSYIWKLIYEQNCFKGVNYLDTMCQQEKILYRIISGLHTSISTHLSNLYRHITTDFVEWADTKENVYHVNQTQYERRVLTHSERIQNLLFLYQILIHAVRKIQPYLSNQLLIVSDNIGEDLKATQLLQQLLKELNDKNEWFQFFKQYQIQVSKFFDKTNPKVKQYQRYFHNISNILNCVQCEKCRLFGKLQSYGLGTALKILLGYQQPYKRNQIVALVNTLNKITNSVVYYFNSRPVEHHSLHYVKLYGVIMGTLLLFLWIATKIDTQQKVKKRFKHAFPPKANHQ